MSKATLLLIALFICLPTIIFSQCFTSPPAPDCTGTEPLLTDNETLNSGTSKWYYGSAITMNSLTLNGGTLIVCGDLSINQFYMNSGTIYIKPGARFVITSALGLGLVLTGNCYIYNYGTCEIQRNLSLDNSLAGKPNIIINETVSSVFKMSNQYLVINNASSSFVNNGQADFWGIITDNQASSSSVCLGSNSITRMAVLINKIADAYRVPSGNACLNVFQFSQFNNRLTNDPGLFACLGSSHNSFSGCGGCPANNWGAAQVFTSCTGCSALTVLNIQFSSFVAVREGDGKNKLSWQLNTVEPNGLFKIERSANGKDYQTIDTILVKQSALSSFNIIDKNPMTGNNYYMIKYINPTNGITINSKPVKVFSEMNIGIAVYPVPFDNNFFINSSTSRIEKAILTDLAGRNIPIRHLTRNNKQVIEVEVLEKIESGLYILHIQTEKSSLAKTIFKR